MENGLKGKKSILWNSFTPQDEITATCNYCEQELSYKSSISNLRKHLERKHSELEIKTGNISSQHQNNSAAAEIPSTRFIILENLSKGKKSILWNHFTPQNEIIATCNFCKHKLSYKSSISNLRQHLQRKHPTVKVENGISSQHQQSNSAAAEIPSTRFIIMEDFSKGKKSKIWNSFTPQNKTIAICNFCKQELSYKSSISNLRQHLQRKHTTVKMENNTSSQYQQQQSNSAAAEILSTYSAPNSPIPQSSTNIASGDCQSSRDTTVKRNRGLKQATLKVRRQFGCSQKNTIDDKLLKLITKDFQPFSIVEDIGFQKFCNALNPSYSLPSRKTLSNTLLSAKYEETQIETRDIIKNAKAVTITTDYWSSCSNDGYMAVTSHFIDDNFEIKSMILEVSSCRVNHTSSDLADELRRITSDWGVDNKILLAISDNASNIKEAISEDLGWKHLGCLAHTINLIVKDALVVVEPLLSKVSDIVSHFNSSTVAKKLLDFYQTQNGKEPKKIIQSVSNMCNSVYFMLDRINELKEELLASLTVLEKEDWPMLTDQEFAWVEELIQILAPIESLTRNMSSEKQVTLSLVIIISDGLQDIFTNLINNNNTFSAQSKHVVENILTGINTHLKNLEASSILLISTLLDPRFKNIGFTNELVSENAKTLVTQALTVLFDEESQPHKESNLSASDTEVQQSEPKLSLWSSFDKKAASFVPSATKTSRPIIELERYLEEPLLPRTENPLNWWRNHAYSFPNLSELVKLKFGTVATSVPCERIFSKTGQLLLDRRSRLSSTKVTQIMFINQNSA